MAKKRGKCKDMSGERHNRLLILWRWYDPTSKRARWLCLCDCDNYIVATGKDVRQRKVQSCGCLRSEMSAERAKKNSVLNTLPAGEMAFNQLFTNYKFHAGKRDLPFVLSREEFKILTKGDCFYCGAAPSQWYHRGHKSGSYIYNGIDRLINSEGYYLNNCVPCCGVCNDMKRTRSESGFIKACQAVVEHQKRRAEELFRLSLPKIATA
jgi:hypothetical protein